MAITKMTDVEAEALDTVLDIKNWTTIHEDKESGDLADAAHIVAVLIDDQPGAAKVVGYRKYQGVSDTSILSEPGFLILSKGKITAANAVEVEVPSGTKYIETGSAYILGRDHGLLISQGKPALKGRLLEQGGQGYKDAAASLVASSAKPVAMMTLHSGGIDPLAVARRASLAARVEEFFNHAHGKGGLFTSGRGSGSAGGESTGAKAAGAESTKTTGQRVASIAKKAAIVAGVAAVALGVVVLAGHSDAFNPNRPGGKTERNAAARQKEKDELNRRSGEMQKRWDQRRESDKSFLEMAAQIRTQNAAKPPGQKEAGVAKHAGGGDDHAHIGARYNPGEGKTADERLHSRESARKSEAHTPAAARAARDAATAKRKADQAEQERRLPKSTAGEYFG